MGTDLKKWQRSAIRNNMQKYRAALEHYYIQNKPLVDVESGKAFSLLSPALGSAPAHRRVRFIMNDIINKETKIAGDGSVAWGSRTPHFITIAVNYDCQCDCRHCSAALYKKKTDAEGGLNTGELKSAIQQTIDLGTTCVILTGGEPLLRQDIYELIASVDKSKSVCALFTNGEFLNRSAVSRLKEAGLFGVFVSLDFPESSEHDRHRGRNGLFEQAVTGIKRCQDEGLLTGISTFITREKLLNGELDRLMALGKELNVLEIFLFDIIATGKMGSDPSCMLKEGEVEQVIDFRKKYNQRPEYPRIIHQTMFVSIAYPCAAEGCPAAVAQLHLRGNGDVSPCDFTPLSFGNIRRRPLKEIWQAMTKSDIYRHASRRCRLSDPGFWEKIQEDPRGLFEAKNEEPVA